MALYGKYRPKNFSDVVGQESIKTTLLQSSLYDRVSHASLFCGTRGTGKTTSARIVAKALNCQNILSTGDPCLECQFCISAEENRMTDIVEIDAASNRGIDEIRALRERVNFSPIFGKAKIYIIDEVHMLTKEAFNALLKTLEEPPSHAYFILATTEFHKVPETIRSRCQIFFFRKISLQDIVSRLEYICEKENIPYSRKGIEIIANRSGGGLRDAISLLEQSASFGEVTEENLQKSFGIISDEIFEDFLEILFQGESKKALFLLDSLQDEGRNLEEFGKDFLGILREKFHFFLHNRDKKLSWVLQIIDIFEEALQKTRVYDIPPLALEIAVAKAMLLQQDFQKQFSCIPNEKKIVEKIIDDKHLIERKRKEGFQNWVNEKPSNTSQITPPPASPSLPKNISSSPYNDDDMFPSSISPLENSSLPPWEEEASVSKKDTLLEKIVKKTDLKVNPEKISSSLSFEENVKKHWSDILSLLPKSVSTNLDKYSKILSVQGNHITFSVSSDSTKKLLNTEKNKEKVQTILSEKFEKKVTVEYIGSEEIPSSQESFQISQIEEKELEISEMESLLKF